LTVGATVFFRVFETVEVLGIARKLTRRLIPRRIVLMKTLENVQVAIVSSERARIGTHRELLLHAILHNVNMVHCSRELNTLVVKLYFILKKRSMFSYYLEAFDMSVCSRDFKQASIAPM
jgi:hypothetical protein